MPRPCRLGVLGLTHDHVWENLAQAVAHPDARLSAAADPHQQLLGRVEQEYHCRPYSNYETMLDNEDLDAVYVYSDNARGPLLTEMAANRGLHVLVEKPMAADLAGAEQMRTAVADAQVRMIVNWPFAWWPQMQHALQLAAAGEIGRVWQVRYRAAHAGPQELGCSPFFCEWLFDAERNGPGGAFMDYCCYGAVLATVLLGKPTSVTAIGGRFVKQEIAVEDNAVLIMKYPDGLAVSEGSWTQIGKLSAYTTVIYGTEGTLMLEPRIGGRLFLATAAEPEGVEVTVPEPPPHLQNATAHLLHHIVTGEPPLALCDPSHCRDAQEILAAGAHSLANGAEVVLPVRGVARRSTA